MLNNTLDEEIGASSNGLRHGGGGVVGVMQFGSD